MAFKTIELKRGFNEIRPFYELCVAHDVVICGGYARYCASPLPTPRVIPAGDVDLFPKSEGAEKAILEKLKEMGFEIRHENHVSITMSPKEDKKEELEYLPVPQVIKPVIEGKIVTLGTIEEILQNFDFTIVRAAILSPTEVMVDEDFENDEKHKHLKLKNIHCPISSLLRCCKYARKGYFMRPGEALKLFVDWTNRGIDYQSRIIELFTESGKGKKSEENPDGMTQEEIDELEALLRVD
jgi:hypothetical protein